jgi:glycogen debranching enzyme
MDEIVRINDLFYIQAGSKLLDDRTRVIKHDETFALFDRCGDIQIVGTGEQGLYHEGTRFLSHLSFRIWGRRPLLLSSSITQDNVLLSVDLTNPDIVKEGSVIIPKGTFHIFRSQFLWKGTLYERFRVSSYGSVATDITLDIHFDADFVDIFEVRGVNRERRGRRLENQIQGNKTLLAYLGLDQLTRITELEWSPSAQEASAFGIRFEDCIAPKEEKSYSLTISCRTGENGSKSHPYAQALEEASCYRRIALSHSCSIETSNDQFNEWFNRSRADLQMLITNLKTGPYPYAGIPWFSTAFGRDGILTALECLWSNPELARGVLALLSVTQARQVVAEEDAQPGKILHETRGGEMARLKEIPFGLYYGSVDSTPLYVLLASQYFQRTGDLEFIRSIWPNIKLALEWIDHYGDSDGDGFVEYLRQSPNGLVQQGWKDSQDSVFHADGRLAEGPIALCEVQAYVYAAKLGAAQVAFALGDETFSEDLGRQAATLQERFEKAFWSEELSTYVLALDGMKEPCQVRTSNAGHALFAGIASPERGRRAAKTFMEDGFFTGWGIRTVHASEVRYNPMSYHNGSVWPHDNALIGAGMAAYGLKHQAVELAQAMFEASLFVDHHRLPELFCGFHRRPSEGPTLYPVACIPQAWSAAAPFLLLQTLLGLSVCSAPPKRICFSHPMLPDFLPFIQISGIPIADISANVIVRRHKAETEVIVTEKQDDLEVVVTK